MNISTNDCDVNSVPAACSPLSAITASSESPSVVFMGSNQPLYFQAPNDLLVSIEADVNDHDNDADVNVHDNDA